MARIEQRWVIVTEADGRELVINCLSKEDAERLLPDVSFHEGAQWTPEQLKRMRALKPPIRRLVDEVLQAKR